MSLAKRILECSKALREQVNELTFVEPTHTVYNPLDYAWSCYEDYTTKYGNSRKKVVFLGMNPGPWGMAQIGIPFGEIPAARDWLKISGEVSKPEVEHPKRLVEGFACTRSEVSGRRLWGLFKERYGQAEDFFQDHFVLNYCPLVFMEESGRNRTPDKLLPEERNALYDICDRHLKKVVEILDPDWVVGVGKFAATRSEETLGKEGPKIGWILHPSPASPAANKDWAGFAQKKMVEMGIWK